MSIKKKLPKHRNKATGAQWLAFELTMREGKKVQISIAQVKEVLAELADLINEKPIQALNALVSYAVYRQKAKR